MARGGLEKMEADVIWCKKQLGVRSPKRKYTLTCSCITLKQNHTNPHKAHHYAQIKNNMSSIHRFPKQHTAVTACTRTESVLRVFGSNTTRT